MSSSSNSLVQATLIAGGLGDLKQHRIGNSLNQGEVRFKWENLCSNYERVQENVAK